MLVYGKCECLVMQMLSVYVLCATVAVLNAGRGCNRRPYRRGIITVL